MSDSPARQPGPLIFISAAEPSADRIGAALIRAVRRQAPDTRFVGVAGPRMVEAGCWSIFDMTRHSAMLLGVLGAAGRGWTLLRTCKRYLGRYRFDAAVVIDSPVLHLPLAGHLTRQGVPVLYYVAPQLWAWGARRIHKLRRRVRQLAVILPFEEEYFRSRGLDATFVGHPMFDAGEHPSVDEQAVAELRAAGVPPGQSRSSNSEPRASARADSPASESSTTSTDHGAKPKHPLVALLPGSRKHVVSEVLPGQLEVAQRIAEALPGAVFGVSVANAQVAPVISQACSKASALSRACGTALVAVQQLPGRHAELIAAADLVLVASGTTTLEVAAFRKPMIVMYNASRLAYHLLARWLVKTPYLSLPNILAGRRIVPEFMPYYRSTEPIAQRAVELLQSQEQRDAMVQDLTTMIEPLQTGNASQRVAEMVLELTRGR